MSAESANDMLVVNAGSSSIKLVLFNAQEKPKQFIEGIIENIGQPTAQFVINGPTATEKTQKPIDVQDHQTAIELLLRWLKEQTTNSKISIIGHRIVHGGPKYFRPSIIDDEMLSELRNLVIFDQEHLPAQIKLVESLRQLFPGIRQVACFDTAFHHDLPNVAKLLTIPRHYESKGLRRYGFHGLSYEFVVQELKRLNEPNAAEGCLIIAHLGSGASLAAVHKGKSIDTTMGLTPTSGVPMSTRSGDLDPGIFSYLAQSEGLDAGKINEIVNKQSGLLGISGKTSDMKQLLEQEDSDDLAKDAVDLFCYQIKKSIGSLAAAMGRLETLVFTGGMGENAPKIRARICNGLEFLGIKIDETRNVANDRLISTQESQVTILVIHTDEALMIAQNVQRFID